MGGRTVDHGINVGVKEEDEEEESLSLCDLPMNEDNNLQSSSSKESLVSNIKDESQEEEFNFCDSFSISREYSEMCAADELFFQGQILPLQRHSVSCIDYTDATGTGFIGSSSTRCQSDHIHIRNAGCRCNSNNSRADSLDRCYSGGLTSTATSSRSSSINSHHSSSSGSTSATVSAVSKNKNSSSRQSRLVPNHFQYYSSHPSPKPQIRTSMGTKINSNATNSNKSSGLWSLFRVGLMTPPEIAIRDLKKRSNSIKNYNPQSFGSRSNSTGSNSSSNTTTKTIIHAKRKQPLFFNKNGTALMFGGCKCTASSVLGPNPARNGGITTNPHENEKHHAKKMTKHHQESAAAAAAEGGGKQALSRHRTFEWLKQLSPEAPAMDQS